MGIKALRSSFVVLLSILMIFSFQMSNWGPLSAGMATAETLNSSDEARIPLGIELSGLGSSREFVDAAKTLRDWAPIIGENPISQDEDGWPLEDAKTVFFDMRPFGAWWGPYDSTNPTDPLSADDPAGFQADMSGTYKLSFKGQAELSADEDPMAFSIHNQQYDAITNTTRADIIVPQGKALVIVKFTNTIYDESSGTKGIKEVKLIRPGYEDRPNQTFSDEFIASLAPFSVLRFMDWSETNSNNLYYGDVKNKLEWSDRKLTTDATQLEMNPVGSRPRTVGVAWEYVVELANLTKKDLWINIPAAASEDYIQQLAAFLKSNLDPTLQVYVEYSNEVWNWAFLQSTYNLMAAQAEVAADSSSVLGDSSTDIETLRMRRFAKMTHDISEIFKSVYGAEAINTTIKPVLTWQFVNPAQFNQQLSWLKTTYGDPNQYLFGIAGGAYVYDTSSADATPEQIISNMTANMKNISSGIKARTQALKTIANQYGVRLMMYEGGPDNATGWDKPNVANKILANRDAGMGTFVKDMLIDNYYSVNDGLYIYFANCGYYSRHGSWGAVEDVKLLDTPKYNALKEVADYLRNKSSEEPPTDEPQPTPLVYEPFDKDAGALLGATSGSGGWSGGWQVQNDNQNVPGYNIFSGSLAYPGLVQSGNYAVGGTGYLSSYRMLDTTYDGQLAEHSTNGNLGRAGTTLWFSGLIRTDKSNTDEVSFGIGNFSQSMITVGYFGNESTTGGQKFWSLKVGGKVYQSNVQMEVGKTALLVAKMEFGEMNTTVSLYANPASLGGSDPAQADAQGSAAAGISLRSAYFYGGSGVQMVSFDEFRLGTTYASVTPKSEDPDIEDPNTEEDFLFTEDFSNASASGWSLGSKLTVGGGKLHADSWSDTQEAVYEQVFGGSYSFRVEIDAQLTSSHWNAARLLWNYQDSANYYELIIGNGSLGDEANVSLSKIVNGVRTDSIVDSVNYLIGGKKTTVQITAANGHISVHALQGSTVTPLFVNVADATFLSGKIGLGMRSSIVDFDNVRVASGIEELTVPVVPVLPIPTMEEGNFTVNGTEILDPDGQKFIAKGVNVNGPRWPWSRDTLQDVDLIVDKWKFNTVRVTMYPRMAFWNISNNMDLDGIINAFTSKHVVTMIEDHDFTGLYPLANGVTDKEGSYYMSLEELKAYWVDLANKYKDNPYVWFNPMNEPGLGGLSNAASAARWKVVHEEIIKAIRDAGAANIIVLDGHNYGQEGGFKNGTADSAILTNGEDLVAHYDNLVFSLHMYGEWMDGQQRLETYLDTAADKGLAVMIGEYGAGVDNATISSTAAMFNAAVPRSIGRIVWAWEGEDQFDLTNPKLTSKGGGWEIDKTDGSRPTNLSWFGNQVWDDNHGNLTIPVTLDIPVLSNGNFESGMDSWMNWSRGEIASGAGINSSKAFRVPANGDGGGGQNVIVKPNTTYKLTVWGRVSGALEGGTADVGFQYRPADQSPDTEQIKYILSFTETAWTKQEITFTTGPKVAQANVFIWKSATNVDFLVDDISLVELPPIIENGSFESGMDGWMNWSRSEIASGAGVNGSKAFKVPADGDGGGGQNVIVKPNTTYKLTAWGKVSDKPENGNAAVGFQYRMTSAPDDAQIQHLLEFTDTSWTKQQVIFTTGPNVFDANVFIWKSAVNIDFLVDDIQIIETTEEATPQQGIVVDAVVFHDASGNKVTSMPNNGLLYAEVTATNHGASQSATLVVALYDRDGDIAALSFIKKSIAKGESVSFTGGFNLPVNVSGYTAKVMIWNNLQEMNPLADAVELNG